MSQDTLPHLPPAPDIPGPVTAESLMPSTVNMTRTPVDYVPSPGMPPPLPPTAGAGKSPAQVEAEMAAALAGTGPPVPELDEGPSGTVYLPGGWLRPDGELVMTAQVRELNGFDEERLSRLLLADNPAVYVTEMLSMSVEDLGGQKPSKDDIRSLLLGDRDQLWLWTRIVTYGPDVEYKLTCTECDTDGKPTESLVSIDLETDIPVKKLDDPNKQEYTVELRRGEATLRLLNGFAQEKFSVGINKKTQAEVNTNMLANSVTSINGTPTQGREDAVRRLSSKDRATLLDFMVETQPGPQLSTEIEAHCSKCNAAYPIFLAQGALFRF